MFLSIVIHTYTHTYIHIYIYIDTHTTFLNLGIKKFSKPIWKNLSINYMNIHKIIHVWYINKSHDPLNKSSNENSKRMFLSIVTWVGENFFPCFPNQNDCRLLNLIFLFASRVTVQTVVWTWTWRGLAAKNQNNWWICIIVRMKKGDLDNWGPNFMRLKNKGSPTENPGYPRGPLRAHIHLPFISASFTIKHISQPSFFFLTLHDVPRSPTAKSYLLFC